MTFRQFVINNVIRNKRLYAAYFLSSMFTVMVFFTFAMFAFHPALNGEGLNEKALFGMGVAGAIIYVFSLFFVLYSMSAFLQSRKKEFGLLMIQGMSMRQIRVMVFLENMLIGLMATLIGIGVGFLFAKAILMIAEQVLIIDQALQFYFPLWAIVVTFVSFALLFLFISFFVTFFLRSKKLTHLIKGSSQPKTEPKASLTLTIIAAVLLVAGYATALWARGIQVIFVMVPVILVVIIGTYLLFTQLSVFIIHRLKKRKPIFWKKTNMILLSDLSFRMKDNARTFFMVAIISTVAFSAIGTLVGLSTYLTSGLKEAQPYSFTYNAGDEEKDKAKGNVQTINTTLDKHEIDRKQNSGELQYYSIDGQEVLITSESQYNDFASVLGKDEISVDNGDPIVVGHSAAMIEGTLQSADLMNKSIDLNNGESLKPVRQIDNEEVMPSTFGYYIVSDEDFKHLAKPVDTQMRWLWNTGNDESEEVIKAGKELMDELPNTSFQAIGAILYEFKKGFGPVMFIGLFIGIVFFVAAGSFLYFRLYSDLDEDKTKFTAIAKLGLTDKELKKVITRQTALLFFAPIAVALVHGAVALTALAHFFDYNLVQDASLVLGSFLVIQVVYFVIVRYLYMKQIKSVL